MITRRKGASNESGLDVKNRKCGGTRGSAQPSHQAQLHFAALCNFPASIFLFLNLTLDKNPTTTIRRFKLQLPIFFFFFQFQFFAVKYKRFKKKKTLYLNFKDLPVYWNFK